MIVLETIIVAFSMFSAIPMPKIEWTANNMRFSLLAFPLIGIVIALCEWSWDQLCILLMLPALLRGAGLCLIPAVMTGGIHLDGYADTSDALASHSGAERRQEILKDPHLGAFAAIRLCIYFVADFALWSSVEELRLPVLLGLFCLSRTLSGLSLTLFPLREGSGLARSFADAADKRAVRTILLITAVGLSLGLVLLKAWELPLAAGLLFLHYRIVCERDFAGLSGDLAGWFLQKAEFWMLVTLVMRQMIGTML